MTVTNTSGDGIGLDMMNAQVEIMNVAFKGCDIHALYINSTFESTVVATCCEFANSTSGAVVKGSSTSAKFKNCIFHDNSRYGIYGSDEATIHLHGEATAIHANGQDGIIAQASSKVIIHLPSHHNTSYNNGHQDRNTAGVAGGTITNVED